MLVCVTIQYCSTPNCVSLKGLQGTPEQNVRQNFISHQECDWRAPAAMMILDQAVSHSTKLPLLFGKSRLQHPPVLAKGNLSDVTKAMARTCARGPPLPQAHPLHQLDSEWLKGHSLPLTAPMLALHQPDVVH